MIRFMNTSFQKYDICKIYAVKIIPVKNEYITREMKYHINEIIFESLQTHDKKEK